MAVPVKEQSYHECLTEYESAKELGFNYKVDLKSVLLDIKALMREYYTATFTVEEDALKLQFNNGQTFILKAEEVR